MHCTANQTSFKAEKHTARNTFITADKHKIQQSPTKVTHKSRELVTVELHHDDQSQNIKDISQTP